MPDENSILAFLHFGYIPQNTSRAMNSLCKWNDQTRRKEFFAAQSPSSLIKDGVNIMKKAFQESISTSHGQLHVLPLSGGLDSRTILGGLLDNLDIKDIQAVTFGTPGTWDYDIGQMVAHEAKIQSDAIDLSAESWKWDIEEMMKVAAKQEQPVWLFDAYVNHQIPKKYGCDCVYWSGFMGDPLAGSHLLKRDNRTWESAELYFAQRNKFSRSLALTPSDFDPQSYLPAKPWITSDVMCFDEQLDFFIRQENLIKNIVLPKGYTYKTPFLHRDWIEFIMNVPRQYRQDQWLYKEILKTAYPKLFALATKNNYGLPLNATQLRKIVKVGTRKFQSFLNLIFLKVRAAVLPGINYIDFNRGLRERTDLKLLVYENIQGLKKRGITEWINIDDIWACHQDNKMNHGDALTLLASLEIHIESGNI